MLRSAFVHAGSGVKALLGGAVVGGLASFISPTVGFLTLMGAVVHDVYKASAGEGTTRQRSTAGLLIALVPGLAIALLPARWLVEAQLFQRGLLWWEATVVSTLAFGLVLALGAVAGALSPQRVMVCDKPI